MLYMGYLIIVNGQNIKKSVSKNSNFKLSRVENCISTVCPIPLGTPPAANTPIG